MGGSGNFTADEAFIVKHFAGDVTYCVAGFLDKNMDPLNEDVEKMMSHSRMPLLVELFPFEEVDAKARGGGRGKKKQVRQLLLLLVQESAPTSHAQRRKHRQPRSHWGAGIGNSATTKTTRRPFAITTSS